MWIVMRSTATQLAGMNMYIFGIICLQHLISLVFKERRQLIQESISFPLFSQKVEGLEVDRELNASDF